MTAQVGEATYAPLTTETLADRLGVVDAVRCHLGDPAAWSVQEVGDGNLNLVFIVTGPDGALVIKQALPYVRLVGEGWPLSLRRAFFEYHALTRQEARAPGTTPKVHYFDEAQALIVMEFLTDHVILRKSLMEGREHEGLAPMLGNFCGNTLFRGSDLYMPTKERKADLALFADNDELCNITENLVFSDPYFDAAQNRHTPGLDPVAKALRRDLDLKVAVGRLKYDFASRAETMLHGDLHTGSIMVKGNLARIIDPEFATYGPMGFDVGMLIANFFMAYYAQPGHAASEGEREAYQEWILGVVAETWSVFVDVFSRLWVEERRGMLFPSALFEDQGHHTGAYQALMDVLGDIWRDTLGFCGVEMHRRILGLAHIVEFDDIADEPLRARCEARALLVGRALIVRRAAMPSMAGVLALVRQFRDLDPFHDLAG